MEENKKESSTAGAAKGGITSLEGLESFNASRKHLGAMERAERGNYLRRADVERLLAAPTEEEAKVVPEGWKLVPVEPTPEMVAAIHFRGDLDIAIGHAKFYKEAEDDYAAMLAAAPLPPATAQAPQTDERAIFEATAPFSQYPNDRNMPDKTYNSPFLHNAWQGWQARAAIASPAVEGKPAVLTDERINQIADREHPGGLTSAGSLRSFARAIEREVLASQQPQVDSSARDQALAEAESIARCYDLGTPDGHAIADLIGARKSSSLPTVAAGLTKEDGE